MQNPVLGIANGAIWCKLWPKTIFEPNYYKVRQIVGSLWDPEIFKIDAEGLPARLLGNSLRKDLEKVHI